MTNVGIVGTGIYIPESFMTGKEISEKTMGVWSEEAVVDKLGIRKKPFLEHRTAHRKWGLWQRWMH